MFLIVSNTVINSKLSRLNNAKPVEMLFRIKSFKLHLYRLVISKQINDVLHRYEKAFSFSPTYSNMYIKLRKQYNFKYRYTYYNIPDNSRVLQKYDIDIVEYFKDKIKPYPGKHYIYTEYIPILTDFLIKGKVLTYLTNLSPSNIIIRDLVKQLKIRKLYPSVYGSNLISDSENEN